MPGRPCTICSDPVKLRRTAELIAAGLSDQAIADAVGAGRMAVARHRTNHVLAPAQAVATAAAKGATVAAERAALVAAAEQGDPAAYLALGAIVHDLRDAVERLQRTAQAAEDDGQRMTVAAVTAQLLRAMETRAKLGGVGGYGAARDPGGEHRVSIQINLPGHTTAITGINAAAPVVEHSADDLSGVGSPDDLDDPLPGWVE